MNEAKRQKFEATERQKFDQWSQSDLNPLHRELMFQGWLARASESSPVYSPEETAALMSDAYLKGLERAAMLIDLRAFGNTGEPITPTSLIERGEASKAIRAVGAAATAPSAPPTETHDEDCPCYGDIVEHSEDCKNCTCDDYQSCPKCDTRWYANEVLPCPKCGPAPTATDWMRTLASAMKKMLPPKLLQEVIDHCDPLAAFLRESGMAGEHAEAAIPQTLCKEHWNRNCVTCETPAESKKEPTV